MFTHFFVAQMKPAIKLRKIDIDSIGGLSLNGKKTRVLYNTAIHRVHKGLREARAVEMLIFFLREIDFEITSFFLHKITVAGRKN